jgi:hypothetical protein
LIYQLISMSSGKSMASARWKTLRDRSFEEEEIP